MNATLIPMRTSECILGLCDSGRRFDCVQYARGGKNSGAGTRPPTRFRFLLRWRMEVAWCKRRRRPWTS